MALRRPPGPRNLPLLGAGYLFQKAPLQRFHGLLRQYGDVVYDRVGPRDHFRIELSPSVTLRPRYGVQLDVQRRASRRAA